MRNSHEVETIASDIRFGSEALTCATGATQVDVAQRPGAGMRRLVAGGIVGAGLLLAAPTADVRWGDAPGINVVDGSSVLGGRRLHLRDLAATATRRMSPEQRALYDEILSICDGFGEPVDVNALVRDFREDLA